jgi:hypothetical protein
MRTLNLVILDGVQHLLIPCGRSGWLLIAADQWMLTQHISFGGARATASA